MLIQDQPDPIRSALLSENEAVGIRHGFFTRSGGVSQGLYRGLNIGTGSADDPELVAENRGRVARWMGVVSRNLLTAHQIHSADVIVVRQPFEGERPKADALVTDRPGIALGASTADCGPVLLADAAARVIAASHAGWKGALSGILENTINAMVGLGASRDRIIAVLGPSISADNYEVGPEFVERFCAANPKNNAYFSPSPNEGRSMFDLKRYTIGRLAAAGVRAHAMNHCTYAEENLFFSYRRSVHRGEGDYGRQISAIVLEDS